MSYKNNIEITDFIARAQHRIIEYGTALVLESDHDNLDLALDLFRAVELITDPNCNLAEDLILQMVHNLSQRANLYDVPVLYIPGFEYKVYLAGEGDATAFSLPKHRHPVSDIDGLDVYIDKLVRLKLAEMLYQLDEVEYAWVQANAKPLVQPVVRLTASLPRQPVNGFFEKGVALTPIQLHPNVTLNSGGKIIAVRIFANNTLISSRTDTQAIYDQVPRYDTVVYRIEVDFEKVGSKTAELNLPFMAPLYYGVLADGATYADLKASGIKQLTGKLPEMAITFPFLGTGRKPVFSHPETAAWKEATEIKVAGFPTKSATNWRIWREEVVLHAESNTRQTVVCYQWLGSYNQEFTYTFLFN